MQGGYYEALATDVDLENKVLSCQYPKAVEGTGREHNFTLPYDVLVVGVRLLCPCLRACALFGALLLIFYNLHVR